MNEDLFEPFEKLVEIEICGVKSEVPENNSLLRCFQYLSVETISFGDFCWNGECANCQIWHLTESGEKPCLACRTKVTAGMKIVRLADEIKLKNFETGEVAETAENFPKFRDTSDLMPSADLADSIDSIFRHR